MSQSMLDALARRFGDVDPNDFSNETPPLWETMASHTSCRDFTEERVSLAQLRALAAIALSLPSKSDLQQRDIVIIENEQTRLELVNILSSGPLGQDWIKKAPSLLVICGNNRRLRQMHEWQEKPFVNDHLDALYNPVLDAGITLAGMVMAAQAAGLGCCPISAVRNKPDAVSDLLNLPDHVFPAVGLAVGYPAERREIKARLPLTTTVHIDRFDETGIRQQIDSYEKRRNSLDGSRWPEQKTNQYSKPERQDFGAFAKAKGFRLE